MEEAVDKGTSRKRAASHQLTDRDDPDTFVDTEEHRGSMPEAPPEVLQQRRIVRVKKRTSGSVVSVPLSSSSSPASSLSTSTVTSKPSPTQQQQQPLPSSNEVKEKPTEGTHPDRSSVTTTSSAQSVAVSTDSTTTITSTVPPSADTSTSPSQTTTNAPENKTTESKTTKESKENEKVVQTNTAESFKFSPTVTLPQFNFTTTTTTTATTTTPLFNFNFNFTASEETKENTPKRESNLFQPPSFHFDFKPSFDFSTLSKESEKQSGRGGDNPLALFTSSSSLLSNDSKRDVQSIFKLTVEQTKVLGENIALPSQPSEQSNTLIFPPTSTTTSSSTSPTPSVVPLTTGEEDEECLLEVDAKLYEFVKEETTNNTNEAVTPVQSWRERGAGRLRLLVMRTDRHKSRLVMRHSRTHKLLLNAAIFAHMSLTLKQDKIIYFNSYSTPNTPSFYSLRLKTVEDAKKLFEIIQKQREVAKENTSPDKKETNEEKKRITETQTEKPKETTPQSNTTTQADGNNTKEKN